ncbi:hypothetical protein SAMN04487947_3361 [Halogeometricum rufum]|uniref:Uncharacterized protein n=1 Tax=Halogeometricum rufum TaxID=553469 RepID=A0A1I6IJN2_9EURY|nr:hypothetical protein [Halogeometricum rufum]SFR66874.1 hypothetical protein SAMN04487947_3361 [Halogeometricum rufum]
MRVPVPKNKLVAFTLVGALLTAGVTGALALPGGGLAQVGEQPDASGTTASDASQQTAATPTPNQDFTPAVQTQSGYEDEEHEEYEEDDEHEEEYEEGHGDDEYEEGHGDDEHDEDE